MSDNALSRAWFRVAAVYFVVAVALGIAMGASRDHSLLAVHAHINLLGWVSMSLFGLLGLAYPAITQGRTARWQFWLHNLSVPVMLVALSAQLKGVAGLEPLIGIASLVVGVGVALFAWLVLTRIKVRSITEETRPTS
jgi:hypothetical protein